MAKVDQVGSRSAKLEELIRKQFTPEGREERIRRSLDALRSGSKINLSLEEWQRILEDPDNDNLSS